MKFKEWFTQRLTVSRYPTPKEIEGSDFDVFINVSDEYIPSCYSSAKKSGKDYHWFPMNECTNDMGLNSIFAALQILIEAEKNNKKVYLHCHAGVNISPTVKECYYLIRTGNFMETENSRLKSNIENGNLPAINKLKVFLKLAGESFEREDSYRGGVLDECKLKSEL